MAALDAWPWARPRCGLALTRHSLVAIGPGGRAERELPDGLVAPNAVTPNVSSPAELARIASDALDSVAGPRATLALALPDLALTTLVVPARRRPSRRQVMAELAEAAPYPVEESRRDVWRGRRGELLAAAIRESIALEYQQIAEANDLLLGWVDGASLARLPDWSRESATEGALSIQVQLYRTHFCLSAFVEGELVDLRIKLRGESDLDAPEREVARVPALFPEASVRSIRVLGEDAAALGERLGIELPGDSDSTPHLDAVLASLMRRGSR